ncbi:membrane protein [Sulfuriferula nivalis]|uniref:Membrane protein n=2 Tax=Sulfuriferula nivalis TaxID=2675298 RepID=A0A809RKJ0_9PROT|nr:membrane protein [Sulfuriferula nivalis]
MFEQVMQYLGYVDMSDLPTIISVIILSSLLSLDNSLVVAAIADKLPRHQEQKAVVFGLSAGILFRLMALFIVGFIVKYPIIKIIGGLYLLYLAYQHFAVEGEEETHHAREALGAAIVAITMADIAFSVDNIVATVAMSPKLMVVLIGTVVGGIAMIFTTKLILKLLKRYHLLEACAYAIVAFVGAVILVEEAPTYFGLGFQIHIPDMLKFAVVIGAAVGTVAYEELQHRKIHNTRHKK